MWYLRDCRLGVEEKASEGSELQSLDVQDTNLSRIAVPCIESRRFRVVG